MEEALLTKDGRMLGSSGEIAANPLSMLKCALTLEDGFTLRSFFQLFERHPVLLQLSEFLPAAREEAANCPDSGCRGGEIQSLVFGKTIELIGFPGNPRVEQYAWLRGTGLRALGQTGTDSGLSAMTGPAQTGSKLDALMRADKELRFIPMQVLLDVPLFLGGLKHVVLGDENRSLICECLFTLFELVDGMAWECSFRGARAGV